MDLAIVEQAKAVYLGKILQIVRKLKIPDIVKDDTHYIKNNTFDIGDIKDEDVKFWFDEAENSIYLEVDNLSASFASTDYKFKYSKWTPTISGTAKVTIGKIMLKIGLKIATQTIQPGNRLLPNLNPVGVAMVIDKDSIKIDLSGGAVSSLVGFFTKFFKETVCDQITKNVVEQINRQVPTIVNPLIAGTNGYVDPIPTKWTDKITLDF